MTTMITPRVRVQIKSDNFAYGVKTAKRCGGTFDASSKTWLIPGHVNELNAPGVYSWRIVSAAKASPATTSPATTYVGAASMDAEDSIF